MGSRQLQGGSKRHLQLSVVPVTRTDERTMGSICRGVFATPFATIDAFPTVRTWAGTVNGVARSAILATAAFLALQTIFAVRALSLTLQKRASKSVRSGYNGIWYKVKDAGFWNLKSDNVSFFKIFLATLAAFLELQTILSVWALSFTLQKRT